MDSKYFLQKLNKKNKILNKIQLTLIFMIITSFLVGFFIRENSAGAGGFNGDFSHVWKNLQTFKNNTLIDSIKITAKKDSNLNEENYFQGTRPPLIYIFQSINPLIFSPTGNLFYRGCNFFKVPATYMENQFNRIHREKRHF